jgi:hypothetical protein
MSRIVMVILIYHRHKPIEKLYSSFSSLNIVRVIVFRMMILDEHVARMQKTRNINTTLMEERNLGHKS